MSKEKIVKIDEVDYKLIAELQRDGRVSLVSLGKKVGLRHPSVRERMLRLIKRGVIKIQANLNLRKMGYYAAFVGLEVTNPMVINNLLRRLKNCPRVLLMGVCSGDYNVFLILIAKDFSSLMSFIEGNLRPIPGLKRVSISYGEILRPLFMPYDVTIQKSLCSEGCDECEIARSLLH